MTLNVGENWKTGRQHKAESTAYANPEVLQDQLHIAVNPLLLPSHLPYSHRNTNTKLETIYGDFMCVLVFPSGCYRLIVFHRYADQTTELQIVQG